MKRFLAILAVLIGVVLIFWRANHGASIETVEITGGNSSPGAAARNRPVQLPPSGTDLAQDLNSPTHDIAADLQVVSTVIDAYRSNFLRDGNPVGNNHDITAALTGDNPLRLALISPTHPAINRAGELCDRWGTPFFFHAESGTQMEIRSAGPDRKLFTADDVVRSP